MNVKFDLDHAAAASRRRPGCRRGRSRGRRPPAGRRDSGGRERGAGRGVCHDLSSAKRCAVWGNVKASEASAPRPESYGILGLRFPGFGRSPLSVGGRSTARVQRNIVWKDRWGPERSRAVYE